MDRLYRVFATCNNLEVDYDKKEIRAKYKDCWGEHILSRDFGMITHYEFEYVKTEWADSDPEDIDSRDHLIQLRETMRVNGVCEELGDFSPEEEKLVSERSLVACDAIKAFALSGMQFAMCNYNNK